MGNLLLLDGDFSIALYQSSDFHLFITTVTIYVEKSFSPSQ